MRDILVVSIVVFGAAVALRRPWVGVLLWTWISLMNPHRYTYGFAYDAPLAAMAAVSTMLGFLFTRERQSPFKSPLPWILVALMIWITLSWLFGLDTQGDYPQWDKVMKIDLMILLTLALCYTKKHIIALTWVCALSLGLLGVKGGVFTITSGGGSRVWGPPGSFIADNNQFALALVMTIPLLRFLQTQLEQRWQRHLMTASMILCAASALGSYSRGALLALSAMAALLWLRGRQKLLGGIVMMAAGVTLVTFMPDQWSDRMSTINQSYEVDRSAHARISAWWNAYGIAKDRLLGVGFNQDRRELFAQYSPYPDITTGPHSIYFQMLGNHGFIGLALFLALFVGTYVAAGKLRLESRGIPEAKWCESLGGMCQVALIGYGVGGAFLTLAYFDLPYYIMVLVVASRYWVRHRGWVTDPVDPRQWFTLPGLTQPPSRATAPSGRGPTMQ